jgi:hypothetical protein
VDVVGKLPSTTIDKKICLLKIDTYITYEHGEQNNRKKQYNARM